MLCRFVAEFDGWTCPDPTQEGSDYCYFHHPDWEGKPSRHFTSELLARAAATPLDAVLRCDGWVCPALVLRERAFDTSVSFFRARFHDSTDFFGVRFNGEEVNFQLAQFHGKLTDFGEAAFHSKYTNFFGCKFHSEDTSFMNANFSSEYTSFFGTEFYGQETSFVEAQFKGQKADFRAAKLNRADLRAINFSASTQFDGAEFADADLRSVHGLILDDCFIRGARFDERARDPWSILRRQYTGIMFALHLILLCVFIAPYVGRTGILLGFNRAQTAVQRLVDEIELLALAPNALPEEATKAIARLAAGTKPCLATNCEQRPVYEVLLGWDRAWYWAAFVAVMFFYNALRALLTYHVSLLRDAEERSGYSPRWRSGDWRDSQWTYEWLYRAHRVMAVLVWFAVGSFALHLIDWLSRPVWLPK